MDLAKARNIYILMDPRTHEVKYVGATRMSVRDRLTYHISHARRGSTVNCHRWILELDADGLVPLIDIVELVSDDDWQQREIFWIRYFVDQGAELTNMTAGGMGVSAMTAEIREKISKTKFGSHHTDEAKLKVSLANRGKVVSQETKDKTSESVRKYWERRKHDESRG